MKRVYFLLIFMTLGASTYGQILERISFEAEYVKKISIGEPTRRNINYEPSVSANVPENAEFNNSVNGINFSLNYLINKNFSIGVVSGINAVKYENNPLTGGEYYDKVMFPLSTQVKYQRSFSNNWIVFSDLKGGYQFYKSNFGNTENGFFYEEEGGIVLGIDFGISKKLKKFTPQIKIGYELNKFSNETSLGNGNGESGLDFNDRISYNTYYNLLTFSIGLKI